MGQKMNLEDACRFLLERGVSLSREGERRKARWWDWLPHQFTGWGPRTPAADDPPPQPSPELVTGGQADVTRHRFEMRRRHH